MKNVDGAARRRRVLQGAASAAALTALAGRPARAQTAGGFNILAHRVHQQVATDANRAGGDVTAERARRNNRRPAWITLDVAPIHDRLQRELSLGEAAAIEVKGGEAMLAHSDVTDSAEVDSVVGQAVARWGGVDILDSNAGVETAKPITETSDAEFARVFDLNVRGFLATARAALAGMKARRSGKVIAISSATGRSGKAFRSPSPIYAGAKAALIGYAKGLAREGAPFGITANRVCPGWIDWGTKHAAAPPEVRAQALREIALGRTGTPEDVAGAVLFLASSLGDDVTGATIDVNGGLYMA